MPNTELGHLELDGHDAELHAAASVREREGIGWDEWAPRVERYLRHVEMLFSPDLFIVGGGASKVADQWLPNVSIDTPIVSGRHGEQRGHRRCGTGGATHPPLTSLGSAQLCGTAGHDLGTRAWRS